MGQIKHGSRIRVWEERKKVMRVPCLVITGREKIGGEEEDSNTSSPGCCLHQLHMSTNKCPLSSSKIGLNKVTPFLCQFGALVYTLCVL